MFITTDREGPWTGRVSIPTRRLCCCCCGYVLAALYHPESSPWMIGNFLQRRLAVRPPINWTRFAINLYCLTSSPSVGPVTNGHANSGWSWCANCLLNRGHSGSWKCETPVLASRRHLSLRTKKSRTVSADLAGDGIENGHRRTKGLHFHTFEPLMSACTNECFVELPRKKLFASLK